MNKNDHRPIFLNEEELYLCGADDVEFYRGAIELAFRLHHAKRITQPNKLYLRWADDENRLNVMPAHIDASDSDDTYGALPFCDTLGVKIVTSVLSNPRERGIARGNTLLLLISPADGRLRAVLEGSKISAMRTAAVTGLAAKHLAQRQSRVLGILGAGPIAAAHAQVLMHQFPTLESALIYDVDRPRLRRFCDSVSRRLGRSIVPAENVEAVVKPSDIVVTATNTKAPLVSAPALQPGVFLSNVGVTEVHPDAMSSVDRVVVDDIEQCLKPHCPVTKALEAQEICRSDISELASIVAGCEPARKTNDETILFTPIGLGMLDAVCAQLLLDRALRRQLGAALPFSLETYSEFGEHIVQPNYPANVGDHGRHAS